MREQCLFRPAQPHVPLERIKRNYDEASYRQLEMEIHNVDRGAAGRRPTARPTPAYHSDRGKELLAQNMVEQAETEFREAISADYNNAAAHAGMARRWRRRVTPPMRAFGGANLGPVASRMSMRCWCWPAST